MKAVLLPLLPAKIPPLWYLHYLDVSEDPKQTWFLLPRFSLVQ